MVDAALPSSPECQTSASASASVSASAYFDALDSSAPSVPNKTSLCSSPAEQIEGFFASTPSPPPPSFLPPHGVFGDFAPSVPRSPVSTPFLPTSASEHGGVGVVAARHRGEPAVVEKGHDDDGAGSLHDAAPVGSLAAFFDAISEGGPEKPRCVVRGPSPTSPTPRMEAASAKQSRSFPPQWSWLSGKGSGASSSSRGTKGTGSAKSAKSTKSSSSRRGKRAIRSVSTHTYKMTLGERLRSLKSRAFAFLACRGAMSGGGDWTPGRSFKDRADDIRSFPYKLGDVIGKGTYATVRLGLNPDTGDVFAIKTLRLADASDGRIVSAMNREVNILKGLDHPNLVRYVAANKKGRSFEIVLEYCSGKSVESLLRQFGPIREKLIRRYSASIFSGITYLHKHRIIHGDVKAANCLIDGDGTLKVADFGCSKQLRGVEGKTLKDKSLKRIRGSVPWMSPEVARGDGYSMAADVWSAGMTVMEMYDGVPRFSGNMRSLFKIGTLETPPQPPPAASSVAVDFLNRCLRIDAGSRPSAARLLRHAFPCTNTEIRHSSNQIFHQRQIRSHYEGAMPGVPSEESRSSSEETARGVFKRMRTFMTRGGKDVSSF